MTRHMSYPAEFKAIDEDKGIVEAIVSVFGNVDFGGDRVVKGAFADSLEQWRESGDMIPVVFSHDWSDLWSHIGYADPKDVEETDVGLKALYHLDINDNPAARQAFKLMKRRTLKEHSFAYGVEDEKAAEDGANELRKVSIIEIGPTLKGMNPATELLSVKSALEAATAMKAGRTISKANESKIRGAISALQEVLSSLGVADEDDEKNSPAPPSEAVEEKALEEVEADAPADEPVEPVGKASRDGLLLSLITQIEKEKESLR